MQNKIFNPLLNETFLIRPTNDFKGSIIRPSDYTHPTHALRYADGKWLPDDGQPDLAFVQGVIYYGVKIPDYTNRLWEWSDAELTKSFLPKYLHKHAGSWHYYTINNTPYDDEQYRWDNSNHPNKIAEELASKKVCELNGCGNGVIADIDRECNFDHPKWISNKMIIIKSTMQPLTKPDNPICYLCLNNGRGHLLKALRDYKENLEYEIEDYDNQISKAQSDIYDWERNKQKSLELLDNATKELRDLEEVKE
ncbi:MAG: hypothetical protein WC389_16825 [Lutibacter sp.]